MQNDNNLGKQKSIIFLIFEVLKYPGDKLLEAA